MKCSTSRELIYNVTGTLAALDDVVILYGDLNTPQISKKKDTHTFLVCESSIFLEGFQGLQLKLELQH